jgi:hypothetical protein
VTAATPPRTAYATRPRGALRRLVTVACVLALVLLGLATPGHAHEVGSSGPPMVSAADHHDDDCSGPGHVSILGHCASAHADACCMLAPLGPAAPTARAELRAEPRRPGRMPLSRGPSPRPPMAPVA